MPNNAVNDLRGNGTLRLKGTTNVGPADEFQSTNTVDSDGVLIREGNNGTSVSEVMGDGRKWMPIQGVTPATLLPGQFFIETFGGVEYFVFIDVGGNPQRLRPTNIFAGDVAVPVGPAVLIESFLVDDVRYAVYDYTAYNAATGAQESGQIQIGNDGSTAGDATATQIDQTIGIAFGVSDITFSVTLAGVGVAQVMNFEATASGAGWAVAYTRRMSA